MAPVCKISYFNMTGIVEPIRYLLAYGKIDYVDERIDKDVWPVTKLSMPFGQVPVINMNKKVINQSIAIARYWAKQVKLAGKDDFQAMEIDAVIDTINDFRLKLSLYAYETDTERQKNLRVINEHQIIPYYLERLEKFASNGDGHLVGKELTFADIYFAAMLNYMNFMARRHLITQYPNLQKVRDFVEQLPGIKEYIAKRPVTDS